MKDPSPPTPETRRILVDRLANNILGMIAEHGQYLEPDDYKLLLLEILDRSAGSLDFISEGKVVIVPADAVEVLNPNHNPLMETIH